MKSVLLVCMLATAPVLCAQQKIVGRVLDSASNRPLRDAMVRIDGTKIGTITNFSGYFELTVDTTSRLTIEHPGYRMRSVKIVALKNIMIHLTRRPVEAVKPKQ